MKKKIAVFATLIMVGTGATGASALNNVQLKGSDSLGGVMQAILAVCPNADPPGASTGITYLGGDSDLGETAMGATAFTQTVTPMGRFLSPYRDNGSTLTCSLGLSGNPQGSVTTAEGLVFGLTRVHVMAPPATGGSAACNGVADCNALSDPNAGLASSTTIVGLTPSVRYPGGGYTFNGWRDVLRVLLSGLEHDDGNDIAQRVCNRELRQKIADNYGLMFQSGSCTSGGCAQIRHIFVPPTFSDAAATLVELLNLPRNSVLSTHTPFCNALRPSDSPPPNVQRYYPDFQDFDPIRRLCDVNEQVCQRNNHQSGANTDPSVRSGLGLVLPIQQLDNIETEADAFPIPNCTSGNFVYAPMIPQTVGLPVIRRCPNGDIPAFDSSCQYPRSATDSFRCLNGFLNRPAFVMDNTPVGGDPPSITDGRVYNLHLLADPVAPSADPTYRTDARGRRMVGAFARIHSTKSITSPTVTCHERDANRQISCLVTASPCSIGLADFSSSVDFPVASLQVNHMSPLAACVETFAYPMTSKLYLNSFLGFQNPQTATHERELAKCLANPSLINNALTGRGFVPLPSAAPGSAPYCEDFRQTQCANLGNPANGDACSDNGTVGLPTASTICGNGVVEFGEQCEDGNNVANDGCSPNCQLEH
jgi:cysteine-rich repeat protein